MAASTRVKVLGCLAMASSLMVLIFFSAISDGGEWESAHVTLSDSGSGFTVSGKLSFGLAHATVSAMGQSSSKKYSDFDAIFDKLPPSFHDDWRNVETGGKVVS